MKKIIALVLVTLISTFSISASADSGTLRKVEAKYVCMINDQLFNKVQIPVIVDGKTYYGCCPMCKVKLKNSEQARTAFDPISKKKVDKATAVIGAAADGTVFYFENETNLKKFNQ